MRLIEHFYSMVAPSSCLGCQNEGTLLCLWCREEALPAEISRCYKCNRLTKDSRTCPACRRKTVLRQVFIRTEYTASAKELVHKMKFSYSGEAADLIAQELLNTIPALPPETIIIHVPTITTHVRRRGFDHARRVARTLAKLANLPHVLVLARLGQHRQVGSKREDRLQKVVGSFRVRNNHIVENHPVLLIDDVLTTGATLEEAALELKKAGAKSVDAAVFARAK